MEATSKAKWDIKCWEFWVNEFVRPGLKMCIFNLAAAWPTEPGVGQGRCKEIGVVGMAKLLEDVGSFRFWSTEGEEGDGRWR